MVTVERPSPKAKPEVFDLGGKAFHSDKPGLYRRMREAGAVCPARISILKLQVFTRYEDCIAMVKDPRFVRDRAAAGIGRRTPFPMPRSVALVAESMITSDDPQHRRLRTLVNQVFKPAAVARLASNIESITHELLDAAALQGEVDLLKAYGVPLPSTIIRQMLGIPEADMPDFARILSTTTRGFSGLRMVRSLVWDLPAAVRFVREMIGRKRQEPGDDVLTSLLHAEEEGDRLSEDEVVAMTFLLIVAGYETTSHLITNGAVALLDHPEALERLRADPSLWKSAVEEILRYASPIQASKPAYATEEISWGGTTIPRGGMVMPLYGSANLDPDAFEEPDTFDITRDPNHHLGFGHGMHFCLGAQLARLETQIALRNLVERNPNLRLAVARESLEFETMPGWHRHRTVPVVLG